jgi:hypothetical protein
MLTATTAMPRAAPSAAAIKPERTLVRTFNLLRSIFGQLNAQFVTKVAGLSNQKSAQTHTVSGAGRCEELKAAGFLNEQGRPYTRSP